MTDMKSLALGKRIQALRKQQGLTQEALSEMMAVSPQAVSKWENAQSCPDIMALPRLANCLGVSIDMLLTGEDASVNPHAPARKPEELIVRMAVEEPGEARICINLPFVFFRYAVLYNMLTFNFSADGDEINPATVQALQNLDYKAIVQMIESGVTGKLLDVNDPSIKLAIWTE